jgi:hypothetical protein
MIAITRKEERHVLDIFDGGDFWWPDNLPVASEIRDAIKTTAAAPSTRRRSHV